MLFKAPETEVKPHIQKALDLADKVEQVIKNADFHLIKGHVEGSKTLLDEKGDPNYAKLRTTEGQDEYADAFAEGMVASAKAHYGVDGEDKPLNELDEQMLSHALYGITKTEIVAQVRKHTDQFPDQFDALKGDIKTGIVEKLGPIPYSHLNKDHRGDILEYTGADQYIDGDKIDRNQAVGLLNQHKVHGAITKEAVRKIVPDYALTDEKLRTDYINENK